MSHAIELESARRWSADALAALFGAVYADYFVPIHVDTAAFTGMIERFDLDRDGSQVAVRDGEPVGIVMLGLRGERAWIGGMGVVPSARRGGTGRRLMRAAAAAAARAGARTLQLEVLEQNAPAIALYESLGFREWRRVEVWSLANPLPADGARAIEVEDALAWIAAHRPAPEPWQRESASVRRFASAEARLGGLELVADGRRVAAAVGIAVAGRASLLQAAAVHDDDATARALLAGVAAWGSPVRALNFPADGAVARVMRAAGATREAGQLEMTLPLGAAASA